MRLKSTIKRIIMGVMALAALILVCGCNGSQKPNDEFVSDTPAEVVNQINYIYDDTAILIKVETDSSSLKFQNLETGLRYTLTYDGTTTMYDRYGAVVSANQLSTGGIYNINFNSDSKKLLSMSFDNSFSVDTHIDNFEINDLQTKISYMGDKYTIDDYAVVLSGNDSLDLIELQEGDEITAYTKDHRLYSIAVDKGHGYLRLINDTYFVDGFIEVGNSIIHKITEGMVLTVPEGSYTVRLTNDGAEGVKSVTIGRGQEVTLDLSDIEVEIKYGTIFFVTEPEGATVYIDGEKVSTTEGVELEYGVHQVITRADGYVTKSNYINVGSASASIVLSLEKADDNKVDYSADADNNNSSNTANNANGTNGTNGTNNNNTGNTTNVNNQNGINNNTANGTGNVNNGTNGNTTTPNTAGGNVNNGGNITQGEKVDNTNNNISATNSQGGNTTIVPTDSNSQTISTSDNGCKVYVDAPQGAEVYADGNYIGIAPTSMPIHTGQMVITLRMTGYQTRSYTLNFESDKADVRYSFSELTKIE